MSFAELFTKKENSNPFIDIKNHSVVEAKTTTDVEVPLGKSDKLLFTCDENKINYSQKNNKYYKKINNAVAYSNTMCNVTSMIMALDYAGFKFPDLGKWEQPEDAFMDFMLNSKEVDKMYEKDYPTMYKDYKAGKKDCYFPNEIHSLLSYATNLWLQDVVTKFTTKGRIKKLLWDNLVQNSLPLVVSGSFPMSNGKRFNHIVTITGVKYDSLKNGEESTPIQIKIDDPNGNPLKDWTGSGNDIMLDWQFCVENLKPLNSENEKWVHYFIKGGAAVI